MGSSCAIIYVLEEPRRQRLLQTLTAQGVQGHFATSGRELGSLAERHQPDFLVLEGPLSEHSGVEPLTWLRKAGLIVPAVFLCGSRYESEALGRHPELSPYLTAGDLEPSIVAELVGKRAAAKDRAELQAVGNLTDTDGRELLLQALRRRWTGRLVLESGGIAKTIFLAAGMPVYCSSNILSENLGRMLVQRGVITQADYERARELQLKDGIRQGEALVRLGVIQSAHLEQYLYDQVYEKLLNALAWTAGQYTFAEDQDFRQRITVFHLNPIELLVEAQVRFHAPREAPKRWPAMRHLWATSRRERADIAALVHRVIPPEMRRALSEPQLLCDLAEDHALDPVHAVALFSTLERSTYLELGVRRELLLPDPKTTPPESLRAAGSPARQPTPVRGQAVVAPAQQELLEKLYEAYFRGDSAEAVQILGIEPGASADVVARARDDLLSRFSEDRYKSLLSRSEHAQALQLVRERIERAAAELIDPKRTQFSRQHDNTTRTTREVSMKKLVKAEEAFQQGCLKLDSSPAQAREFFHKATELHQKDPLYLLYYGWASYLCATSLPDRADAQLIIERAVEANPIFAEGHVFLARVLKDLGRVTEAVEQLNTALAFDQENKEAKALLRDLGATRKQRTPR